MKLLWGGLLGLFLLVFLSSISVNAGAPGSSALCPPPEPNSAIGLGAVSICNINYTCGGFPDGVCPEDFQDPLTSKFGDCSLCPDPDCEGFVNGTVYDNSTGIPVPLQGANVSTFFGWDNVAYSTGVDGYYEMNLFSGIHTIGASKQGYDTQIKEVTINNIRTEGNTPEVDFYLPLGVCHADCSNEFGRCNPGCEGFSVINETGGLDTCEFDPEVMLACANKELGTDVYMGPYNETHSYFANCCEGSKELRYNPVPEFTCPGGKGLIKVQKIVKYQGKPAKLVVAVCK